MSPEKIGRNDPCPCGSGKKYKRCCYLKPIETGTLPMDDTPDLDEPAKKMIETLLDNYLDQVKPSTPEEFDAAIENFERGFREPGRFRVESINSDDLWAMFESPYTSPQVVQFAEVLDVAPSALIIDLFDLLVKAIGTEGLKATAKGNLPRKISRSAGELYNKWAPDRIHPLEAKRIWREEDVIALDITRVILELAGLLIMRKGRFLLTKKARKLMEVSDYRAIYPVLLKTYIMEYNWAYGDGAQQDIFINLFATFTLYQLSRGGGPWKSPEEYSRKILELFPGILDSIHESLFRTKDESFDLIFSLRMFDRFTRLFGLTEFRRSDNNDFCEPDIRATPLIDHVVTFTVESKYL